MAGSKSDVYEVDVLKATTGQTTTILVTTPITPYLALYTVAPSDSAAGTEVSGGSYARVSSAGKWATPSAGSVSNNATITFPVYGNPSGGLDNASPFAWAGAPAGSSINISGTLEVRL